MLNCPEKCGKAHHGHFRKGVDCLPCWLALNSGQYRKLTEAEGSPVDAPIRNPACARLEIGTIHDTRGVSCLHKWIVGCEVFGRCTTGEHVEGVANCPRCPHYTTDPLAADPVHIEIVNDQCPGDVLAITGAIRSLHKAHPGRFLTSVRTTAPDLWWHNPDVFVGDSKPTKFLVLGCEPAVHESDARPVHIMGGYAEDLAKQLGLPPFPLATNRPHVVLSAAEKAEPNPIGKPFWVLNAGHKADWTAKFWGHARFFELVEKLKGKIDFVQIGEASPGHEHKRICGAIDYIGKTSPRELLKLVRHSSGGVGPVTFLGHACAAMQKPYVCLHGGREPLAWTAYPKQTTLHTLGKLDCCRDGGCWKSQTVRMNDGDPADRSVCSRPVTLAGETVPQCMASITVDQVAETILAYGGR